MNDRIAALVDLMGFLFFLAVLLFFVTSPRRPTPQLSQEDPILVRLSLTGLASGSNWQLANRTAPELGDNSDFSIKFYMSRNGDIQEFEDVARNPSITFDRNSESYLLTGELPSYKPSSFAIVVSSLNNFRLIGSEIGASIDVRMAHLNCSKSWHLVLGRDPGVALESASC